MAMVASKLSSFTEATMVASSSNLARSLWDGTKTQGLKEQLVKMGITADQLDESWEELGPNANVKSFKGKKAQVHIATRDKIVPSAHQRDLLVRLNEAGADTKPKHLRLGHYATLGMFYYFGN